MALDFTAVGMELRPIALTSFMTGRSEGAGMAWLYQNATSLSRDGSVMRQGVAGATSPLLFWRDDVSAVGSAENTLALIINPFCFDTNQLVAPTDVMVNEGWYHVGFSFKASGQARLYLNGVQIASKSIGAGSVIANTDPMTISDVSTSRSVVGQIEDARFYSRELSAAEWAAIYRDRGMDDVVEGLVFRLALNEVPPGTVVGTGVLRDLSPNGNDFEVTVPGTSPTYRDSFIGRRRSC